MVKATPKNVCAKVPAQTGENTHTEAPTWAEQPAAPLLACSNAGGGHYGVSWPQVGEEGHSPTANKAPNGANRVSIYAMSASPGSMGSLRRHLSKRPGGSTLNAGMRVAGAIGGVTATSAPHSATIAMLLTRRRAKSCHSESIPGARLIGSRANRRCSGLSSTPCARPAARQRVALHREGGHARQLRSRDDGEWRLPGAAAIFSRTAKNRTGPRANSKRKNSSAISNRRVGARY